MIDVRARGQYGLVTLADARSCGMSRDQVYRRVASGRIRRCHPGVFALAGAPETWEQTVMAAVLAGGEGALASHTTAAALWVFPGAERERLIEITVDRPRLPRLAGARVHRSVHLTDDDRTNVVRIAVTSIPRTLVDLAAVRGLGWLARAMDDSLRRDRTTLQLVNECSERLGGAPGRRPSVVRLLVDERLSIGAGKTESWLERTVLGVLLDAGVVAPELQHSVAVDGTRYRLDFAWPAQRVALEVDGFGPHSSYAAFHDDRRRDLALQRVGWRVLHVTGETPVPQIVASVTAALAR
jgi:very-short-patch-repair endonuclease